MKVLNVNMVLDPVTGGGSVERTVKLSKYLVYSGIECTILTTDLFIERLNIGSLSDDGVNIVALRCINKRYYIPRLSIGKIEQLVHAADMVHMTNHWTLINALVYAVCRKLHKPYVVCPAGALPVFGRSAFLKRMYNAVIGKRIVRNASGHIAITADEVKQFEPYNIFSHDVTVIPNGVDQKDFIARRDDSFRKKYNLPSKPIILFVGRLNLIKGPDLLLEAFIRVCEVLVDHHLVFAGPDGGMLANLEKMAADARIQDRVHFLGYVGGDDKSSAYHAAQILVIPSRQEAMSIVALEAGIAGTPVLLTDRCGFNQVEKVDGGRVVGASAEDLKTGLLSLLAEPERLPEMGGNLQKMVAQEYTWTSVVEKYLGLYKRIARGAAPV